MEKATSWFKEHLAAVLIGEAAAVAGVLVSLIAYSVRLEARVSTLEIRGSPHLERIDHRLTSLESAIKDNTARIDRVVDVMTRELGKKP
jgi:hypothetical protein